MSFVKLDQGLLSSTLWVDRDGRDLFITALLLAEPFETRKPMSQLIATPSGIMETGFVVPAGWYGFVPASGPGICHRAGATNMTEAMAALQRLGEPDPESRTPDFDGRRLIRVDGGYLILNFIKYRDKDSTTAERSKRWRARQKLMKTTRVTDTPSRVI